MRRSTWACAVVMAVLAAVFTGGTALADEEAPPPGCTSLENCYGYADMQAFYEEIIGMVGRFSTASYASMPAPRYFYVPAGYVVRAAPGCGEVDATAFLYCNPDQTVYVGQDKLWQFYSTNGDAAAGFAIAHEWAHHVQNIAGVQATRADPRTSVVKENQADCIGGAWIGYVDSQGQLEPDDLADLDAILPVIAAAESDGRTHGTLEERTLSVRYGIDRGLYGCNDYVPGIPIIT